MASTSVISQGFIGKCFLLTVRKQHRAFLENAVELELDNPKESYAKVQDSSCLSQKTRGMNYGSWEQLYFLCNDKLAHQFVSADSWTTYILGR